MQSGGKCSGIILIVLLHADLAVSETLETACLHFQTYFICLTIVLFPDSPAPEMETKRHVMIGAEVKHSPAPPFSTSRKLQNS